jgi:hypothetical protein
MAGSYPHFFEGVNAPALKTLQSQIIAGSRSLTAMAKDVADQRREAIKAFMKRRGLNPWRWGKLAGLSDGTLRAYFAGDTAGLNNTTLEKLARAADVTVAELLGETVPLDSIMVVGAVQAGVWREALEWPESDWYPAPVAADRRFLAVPQFGLVVRGPSMNELYPDGSVVVCVKLIDLGRDPRPFERVVVQRRADDGYEATVKELRIDDRGGAWLWPRSTDPNFQQPWRVPDAPDGHESEDITVVALVIGSYRMEG